MRVFVLVENFQAYLDWCAARRVNPKAAEYVTDPLSLLGQLEKGDQVIDARGAGQDLPRLVA